MKILLINPPIREWAKPNVLPLGLGYIAAVLLEKGHYVEVMDINAYRWTKEETSAKLQSADFDLYGIGAIVTVYPYVKWLTTIIKKYHPDKKIIVGGSVGTSVPQIILDRTDADIVCIGEGEQTVLELVSALEVGTLFDNMDGLWFSDAQGRIHKNKNRLALQDLDLIPFPSWDLSLWMFISVIPSVHQIVTNG